MFDIVMHQWPKLLWSAHYKSLDDYDGFSLEQLGTLVEQIQGKLELARAMLIIFPSFR